MATLMVDSRNGVVGPAALMILARLVNMAVGLVSIPILIHYLGGTGFAAWAIFLALGAGFSLLEIGGATVVRFLVLPAAKCDWMEVRSLLGSVWLLLALNFGIVLGILIWIADPIAAWLRLPHTAIFTASECICVVFIATALRAFLQCGTQTLYAEQKFLQIAAISLAQPLLSNIAAILTAWKYGRLDVTILSYWIAQVFVVGFVFYRYRHHCMPRLSYEAIRLSRLWKIWSYYSKTQIHQCAQFVNFQVDKFIISGLVGVWAVAPYEVANRSVFALRSVAASGEQVSLPMAVKNSTSAEDAWKWYAESTRFAAYGMCVFMLAPLAISPVFLYAWAGEMGYVGSGAFVALIIGAMANMLALPAATLIQTVGLPGLPARMAVFSILLNIPISLLLVTRWGLTGAAVGTALVMIASAGLLLHLVHRHFGRPLKVTLRILANFWPLLLVCGILGGITYLLFNGWFAMLEPGIRFARENRIYPGILAVTLYVFCLMTMFGIELFRGSFTSSEYGFLMRLKKYCSLDLSFLRNEKR